MTVPKVLFLFLLFYAFVNPAALVVGVPACIALYFFSRWYVAKTEREIEADREHTRGVIRRRAELEARVRELEGQ